MRFWRQGLRSVHWRCSGWIGRRPRDVLWSYCRNSLKFIIMLFRSITRWLRNWLMARLWHLRSGKRMWYPNLENYVARMTLKCSGISGPSPSELSMARIKERTLSIVLTCPRMVFLKCNISSTFSKKNDLFVTLIFILYYLTYHYLLAMFVILVGFKSLYNNHWDKTNWNRWTNKPRTIVRMREW